MLKKDCNIDQVSIQRAHRTGRMKSQQPGSRPDKPRPIHVGFTFFQEKEKCRKALADLFKSKIFGPSQAKLFVANDYSQKVQQLRRDKLKELRGLKNEGKTHSLCTQLPSKFVKLMALSGIHKVKRLVWT